MPKITVTREHALKVRDVVRCGLTQGKGYPVPGQMCVEAAVCFALGLPHSDDPPCVSRAVRSFKIGLNDSNWPSEQERAKGMEKIAIAQLGSDTISDAAFTTELAKLTVKKIVPLALRAAARIHSDDEHRNKLEQCAKQCEAIETLDAASDASGAASDAASDAASYAASDASGAARAASDAASYAASDAASYAASYASGAARLSVLRMAADIGVAALKVAGSLGCQWIDLVEDGAVLAV